jgi:DNA-binding transcriptional LysR family regulator
VTAIIQPVDLDAPNVTLLRRTPRMATNVPTDLLRTFVAIVDAGSMALATETIFLTQSALSLQMKRLEDLLQQRVFQRNGRSLVLTAAGEELVGLARRLLALNDHIVASLGAELEPEPLQLGLVQDFADTILPEVLAAFASRHPRMRIQLRIGGSAELLEQFDRARLDVVMCMGRHGQLRRATSRILADVPMVWIGNAALLDAAELPLVLLDEPCAFRRTLLEALERDGRPYRIVLETPSLPGLRAALRAGIGISCRTAGFAEADGLPLLPPGRLPTLARIDTVLLCRDPASNEARDLAAALHLAVHEPRSAGVRIATGG